MASNSSPVRKGCCVRSKEQQSRMRGAMLYWAAEVRMEVSAAG